MASHIDDDDDCTADETVALKSKDCSSDQHKDTSATVEIGMVEISPSQQPPVGSRNTSASGDPAAAQAQSATTGAAAASAASGSAGNSSSRPWSRIPILFERSARSWWNPRFDSDALEKQLIASSFSQTRRRFRFALGYVMLNCAAWCVFFAVCAERRTFHWAAFVVGTAILLAVCAAAFALTFTGTYRSIVLPVSLVVTGAMCVGDLMTFVFGRQSEMSAVGTFAWSVEIVLLMYTLIPMPLYMCTIAGVCYSIGFELLAAFLGEMQSPRYVIARALLHISIHAIGIHVFVMSQVRQRSTFLKVGQSLMLRRALQTEKQIKHNMIHSLMPPKVAEEVMKSREMAAGDDELQELLVPSGRSGGVGRSRVNGTGAAPNPAAPVTFRTFHMDKMDDVSILFADIVGFTKMSSNKSAEHLVRLLNDLFGRFDDVCRRNNCEKISTLGDCYYCVSGCPEPRPDHAQCCVEMGLAMCVAIQEFDKVHNEEVNMRVGVHTGAVLCGIVGTRRFKFDVWSHDVTLANMMESEGQPGRVHISNKTYGFIKEKYEVEPGEDVQDIRKHKELIECFDPETGKYVVKQIEKGTASESQNVASIKTWFIVRRLFDVPTSNNDAAAAAPKAQDESKPSDATKVAIDGDSVVDGQLKEKVDNKDLSAVQLLGKRDNVMTSQEELNGEVSGASGLLMQRAAPCRDESDRQLIECLSDESVSKDYLYNPSINQCTLTFSRPLLERAYQRHFASGRLPTDGTSTSTLSLPSYSSLFDMIISALFFSLIVIACFVGFSIRVPWVVVCIVGLVIEVTVLLIMLAGVCVPRTTVAPQTMLRFLSSWYPRHVSGIFITSLPSIAVYAAFYCAMFKSLPYSDRFYCLVMITTLLHYCNFTLLSSWMKSILATVVGVVLVILVGVDFCSPPSGSFGNFTGDVLNGTTDGPVTDGAVVFVDDAFLREIFSAGSYRSLKLEIILDVLLFLLLVWFLNREIEISYRLCFHGDVEAVLDRKKIQAEKEQADWLLHNIVPEHVAYLLKTHEFYSHTYADVGIIFAKISNFDDFYDEAYQGGKEFLRVLNELMGDFEDLFDLPQYKDVEKIKTIGSCLMAASGLNAETRAQNRDPVAHLYALMDFACALLQKLDQFNRDMLSFKFEMEIGFNFGEVTAGVVGTTKLLYDIWGDAVNVASRMYSTGVHGKIQVTDKTAEKLGAKFEFEYRGKVFVKGKGDMNTYLLKCKKPGATWD